MRLVRWTRDLPATAVVVLALGCGARNRSVGQPSAKCEAVPAEFSLPEQTVYRDCAVDRRAQLTAVPHVNYRPSAGQTCVRARIDVVVDSAGRPRVGTAQIVRGSDPIFAAAVADRLEEMRFEPAVKDGQRVAQLVRLDQAVSLVGVVVPAGTSPRSVRPPRRPRC